MALYTIRYTIEAKDEDEALAPLESYGFKKFRSFGIWDQDGYSKLKSKAQPKGFIGHFISGIKYFFTGQW